MTCNKGSSLRFVVARCISCVILLCRSQFEKVTNFAADLNKGVIGQLPMRPCSASQFAKVGPLKAVRNMKFESMSSLERMVWMETARAHTILENCRLSWPSVRSGLRCYIAYIGKFHISVPHLRFSCSMNGFVRQTKFFQRTEYISPHRWMRC